MNRKQLLAAAFAAAMALSTVPLPAFAAGTDVSTEIAAEVEPGTSTDETATPEKKFASSGWVKKDSLWYYRNSNGSYRTGWQKIDRKWYYFDPYGYYMYSGGVSYIDDVYYNFSNSGALTTGWYKKPDTNLWYYSNSSGVLQTRWHKIGGKWYYFDPYGCYMYSNTYEYIDGKEYQFDASGACLNP